jgi:hypothetical protein
MIISLYMHSIIVAFIRNIWRNIIRNPLNPDQLIDELSRLSSAELLINTLYQAFCNENGLGVIIYRSVQTVITGGYWP